MLYCSVATIFNYQNHLCQKTPRRRSSHSDISSEEEAPTLTSLQKKKLFLLPLISSLLAALPRNGEASPLSGNKCSQALSVWVGQKQSRTPSTRAKRQTPGAPRRRPDTGEDDGCCRRRHERPSSRNGRSRSKPRGRLLAVPEPRRKQARFQRTCFRASRFSEPIAVPFPFRRVQPARSGRPPPWMRP
jgi:hypothetical protein